MRELLFLIFLWGIVFVFAFFILPVIVKYVRNAMPLVGYTQLYIQNIVTRALHRLNCEYKVEKQADGTKVFKYSYQGTVFQVLIDRGPYVSLVCPSFFTTSTADIEVVRILCNYFNIVPRTARVYYESDTRNNQLYVSMKAVMLVTEKTVCDILHREMDLALGEVGVFAEQYQRYKQQADRMDKNDLEKLSIDYEHELFLLHEQEIMHQDGGFAWHMHEDATLTIAHLMSRAFGLDDIVPIKATVTGDSTVSFSDSQHIADYDLTQLGKAGVPALLSMDFYDATHPQKVRRMVGHIQPEGSTSQSVYFRLSLMLVPPAREKDDPVSEPVSSAPLPNVSLLAAWDKVPSEDRLKEFQYMWKDALQKERLGQEDEMSPQQRFMLRTQDAGLSQSLYTGRKFFDSKCYAQALPYLENSYWQEQKRVDQMSDKERDNFAELSFLVGFCYTELHEYRRAYFYLNSLLGHCKVNYTEEFVNALVNSNDYRALGIIDQLLAFLENKKRGQEDDNINDHFLKFLLRRKAYLLVEKKRYDEAGQILHSLLDDPSSSDFAIDELAWIQKKKSASEE